jgi:leader peptidase (prepilin peptidase)/N-methyltransferase
VLGWLILKGRCADCGTPFSPRYPLVELTTGVAFVALTMQLSELNLLSALPAYLFFAAIGIALALIDVDCRRLPNAITLPSYPVLAILLTLSAAWQHDWWALARAGLGAAALFGFYLVLRFVHPAGMGLGDVRLAGILGGLLAYLSWSALVIGAFGGFLLGAVVGVAVIISGRGTRKTELPFGPFMITATMLALFAATPIAENYLNLVAGRPGVGPVAGRPAATLHRESPPQAWLGRRRAERPIHEFQCKDGNGCTDGAGTTPVSRRCAGHRGQALLTTAGFLV